MKLDSLSKILIATGQINYMAASIFTTNEQMRLIEDNKKVHQEGIVEKEQLFLDVVTRLSIILEDIGNFTSWHG